MIYRISLFVNTALSLLFILLGLIALFTVGSVTSASVFVFVFLFIAFGFFLLFDYTCFRVLGLNKEKLPLKNWIKTYGKIIFVFGILALLLTVFTTIAATYAFVADMDQFPERQRPFYIAFLLLLVLSAVSFIFNAVGYFKAVKENKKILIEYIDDIGSAL